MPQLCDGTTENNTPNNNNNDYFKTFAWDCSTIFLHIEINSLSKSRKSFYLYDPRLYYVRWRRVRPFPIPPTGFARCRPPSVPHLGTESLIFRSRVTKLPKDQRERSEKLREGKRNREERGRGVGVWRDGKWRRTCVLEEGVGTCSSHGR